MSFSLVAMENTFRSSPKSRGRARAALAQFELDVDDVGAMLAEPRHAVFAAGLFVGDGAEYEVSLEGEALALQQEEGEELHHAAALHIHGAAAVNTTVFDHAFERGDVPVLFFDRHDIGVVAEHEGALRTIPAQPGD